MNDQSHEDGHMGAERKRTAPRKFICKQDPEKAAKFHFTVDAENPKINVTIAPIDLKLPPPPWPDWPKPQPNP
jgi:hypothetical protein